MDASLLSTRSVEMSPIAVSPRMVTAWVAAMQRRWAHVVNGKVFLVSRLGAAIRTADGCDEVHSKPAHAKPACAAANFVPAVCVCATLYNGVGCVKRHVEFTSHEGSFFFFLPEI